MYCPDTLNRLDDEAVAKAKQAVENYNPHDEAPVCDFCDKRAKHVIPVYNPADAMRTPKVCGAYHVYQLCDEHFEDDSYMEENFHCAGCGELFIYNHSWDTVAVKVHDVWHCQECAAKQLEPKCWWMLKNELLADDTHSFIRLNGIPEREKVWEGEYSDYSDFPGHTSLRSVIADLDELLDTNDEVYPLITHGYQFSVALAIYK